MVEDAPLPLNGPRCRDAKLVPRRADFSYAAMQIRDRFAPYVDAPEPCLPPAMLSERR